MKANLHLPVLAMAGGGILSNTTGLVTCLLLGVLIIWLIKLREMPKWIVILSAFIIFGYIYFTPHIPSNSANSPTLLEGKLISPITETGSTIRTVLRQQQNDEKVNIIYFKKDVESAEINHVRSQLKHGAQCTFTGESALPDQARNPGQFDYRHYLNNQQIFWEMTLQSPDQFTCKGQSLLHKAYKARSTIIDKVKKAMDPQAFAWASALVFGDTQFLSEERIGWFRDFSLSHILAISGLHVGLFLSGVFLLLFRSGFMTMEQARGFILFILPAYSFLSGAAPSVLRAVFMAVFLLLVLQLKIKAAVTDVLALVAFLLLLISPSYFYNLGFQFSFIVTFSLLLSYPLLKHKNVWVVSAIISFISQTVILPLQLHYFYQMNPLSLAANVLLVPYFSFIIIPLLFLLVCLSLFFPSLTLPLSGFAISLHEQFLNWLMVISRPFNIQWVVGELPLEWILLYFIFFCFMMSKWVQNRLRVAFLFGVSTVVILASFSVKPYLSEQGTVTMLDIGQGDSFVIELPHRKGVLLIDAAGPPIFSGDENRIADHIIAPFLKSRGIKQIDALIISHMDSDHSGSVDRLVDLFHVEEIYVSPYHTIEQKNVKRVEQGDVLKMGGYNFEVLHPRNDEKETNENSVVIHTQLGGRTWLFTGDVSTQIEEKLFNHYPSLSADVLKVGHHGSHTSTSEAWLRDLNPSVALVSAGVDNRYGHPHGEVIERLLQKDVLVLRTDIHGAVQYHFAKQSGTFSTFLPYNAENRKRLP
ncbi:DNA internalization-related competence protein ComEC/Rec2 [Halobacillus shinanisalinarum]|uniref:DNA internalization-related competence protein ComEC/Rec2 n=1 Tax=Halobacillus shinanisalinarum TaxID=2932258 RepID=A0ABY4H0V0_9BACI|nr:DNA internalization-related competence protein ComEC/Rec2 [Halobacillus shinanisalinarum]UOQ93798.1 DNA internalization-related competence protein ComEC/Rec2 [Halobacillus shinanisalinarum]